MITMAIAVLLILLGLMARYGRAGLRRLARLKLRSGWLLGAALVLQAALLAGWQPALLLTGASALCIGLFGYHNRRRPGLVLAAGGALLNFLVMSAAGGLMPVQPDVAAQLGDIVIAEGGRLPGTRSVVGLPHWESLAVLSDWLLLPDGTGRLAAWSIGDLLLLSGIALFIRQAMKETNYVPVR
jgi:hypothetical protein